MSGNPARKSGQYRRNRAIIRARGDPCARCGMEIEYDAPRYLIVNGVRRENPWAFDCGHIVAAGARRHRGAGQPAGRTRAVQPDIRRQARPATPVRADRVDDDDVHVAVVRCPIF